MIQLLSYHNHPIQDNFNEWVNHLLGLDTNTRCRIENRIEDENIRFRDIFRINVIPKDKELIYTGRKINKCQGIYNIII